MELVLQTVSTAVNEIAFVFRRHVREGYIRGINTMSLKMASGNLTILLFYGLKILPTYINELQIVRFIQRILQEFVFKFRTRAGV